MKYLIIILSLLILTEIQFTLCAKLKSKSATINVDESTEDLDAGESETLAEIGLEDSEDEANGSVIKNVKLPLEKVKQNFKTLIKNAVQERDIAFKKINEQYENEKSRAVAIEQKAMKTFAEAEKLAEKEYQQTKTAAQESYKKAAEQANGALNTAEKEFGQAYAHIQENQQKAEAEHQPELEKARKEKEIALGAAKDRLHKAREKYKKARKSMQKASAEKIEMEFQDEVNKFKEAFKLADQKWQNVLDGIGITKQFKEAKKLALKKLKQAEDETEAILDRLSDTREKALKEARAKRDGAINQAKADKLKSEKEGKQILEKAVKQAQCIAQKVWAKWTKIQTQANEDLKKAIAEVVKAQNDARNERKKHIQTNKERGKKLTTMASASEKIVKRQLSTPKKNSKSKILENEVSSQGYIEGEDESMMRTSAGSSSGENGGGSGDGGGVIRSGGGGGWDITGGGRGGGPKDW